MLLLQLRHMLPSLSFILFIFFASCTCTSIWQADQLTPLGDSSSGDPLCPVSNDFEDAALLSDYLMMNLARYKTEKRALSTSCAYTIVERSLKAPTTMLHLDDILEFGLRHASRFPEVFDLVSTRLTYPVYSSLKKASTKLNAFLTCPESFCSFLTLTDLFELDSMFADSSDAQARISSSVALFKSTNCITCTDKLSIGNQVSSFHHRPHQFITNTLLSSDFLGAYLPYYPILLPAAFHALSSSEHKKNAFLEPSKIAKEIYANLTLHDLCPIFLSLELDDMERLAKLSTILSSAAYDVSEFNKCVPVEILHDLQATKTVEAFKKNNAHFFSHATEDLLLARLESSHPLLFDAGASTEKVKTSMGPINDESVIRFLCAKKPSLALTLLSSMTDSALQQSELSDVFFNLTAGQCVSQSLSVFANHETFGAIFLTRNVKSFEGDTVQSSCSYELLKNSLVDSNVWQQYVPILNAIMDEKAEPMLVKIVFDVVSDVVRQEIINSEHHIMKRRLFLDALNLDTQKELYGQLELLVLQDILSGSFTATEAGARGLAYFVERLASAGIKVGAQVHDLTKRPTSINLVKAAEKLSDSVNEFLLKKTLLVMLNVSAPISVEEFRAQSPLAKKEIFLFGHHYMPDIYTHIRPIDFQDLISAEEISVSDVEALNLLLVDLFASSILFGSMLKYGEHLSSDGLAQYSDCSVPTSERCERSKEFIRLVSKNIPVSKKGILGGLF